MINRRFGKLVVTGLAGRGPRGVSWQCRCDCGKVVRLNTFKLTKDGYASCGCERRDWSHLTDPGPKELRKKFPLTHTSWRAMFARCLKNRGSQDCYKGVTICERWCSFTNFLEDMGPRPGKEMSIDRKDPTKGYEPTNCRWVTKSFNSANVRRNISPERGRRISDSLRRGYAEGRIVIAEETRKKIAAGAAKRVGRKLQNCSKCGRKAYLPVCQKCRG